VTGLLCYSNRATLIVSEHVNLVQLTMPPEVQQSCLAYQMAVLAAPRQSMKVPRIWRGLA
jgi:hypothetical protein